jgi:hypothetical protein
VYTNDGET